MFMSGYKTYALGFGAIIGAIFAAINGYMAPEEAFKVIFEGALAVTIRHAIGKRLGS